MPPATITPLVRDLRRALGAKQVLWQSAEMLPYECDGLTIQRRLPDAVVFPRSTDDVVQAVTICRRHGSPIVPRGAGTSLAGGCVPITGGVVLMLTRMTRILEVNLRDRMALVEAGVRNLELGRALDGSGFHFAPDPSSQTASTLGGNVATNAGGPHTLKYGVTANHVLGLEAVLTDGSVLQLGPEANPGHLDLIGLLVGGEGTLAVITKVWVRLTPNPEDFRTLRVVFETVDDATNAISEIIGRGIVPAAMELMDQGILAAVEEAYHRGFPTDAGAIVVIEIDGPTVGLNDQQEQIAKLCRKWRAREIRQAADAQQRAELWQCRKMAVGAVGRLSPSYLIQDGVVPRTRLPHILRRIVEIGQKHGIRIVNVAHAGDGNVHPILLFDERNAEQTARAMAAGRDLLAECLAVGGSVTAEHGIGIEKLEFMDRLFGPADMAVQRAVRQAFDPHGVLNPGKVTPEETMSS